jgi:hypothetical protein
MKQLIIALILLSSCDRNYNNDVSGSKRQTPSANTILLSKGSDDNVMTIEHDSCEYILFQGFQRGGIIHKQNCKYCKQRNQK